MIVGLWIALWLLGVIKAGGLNRWLDNIKNSVFQKIVWAGFFLSFIGLLWVK
jgi:hypothetical protein